MANSRFSKLFRHVSGWLPLLIVTIYIATAIGVEIYSFAARRSGITPVYELADEKAIFLPPGKDHYFGTDYQGRDVFWRAVAGCSGAVKVGVISGIIVVILGVALGTAAGYYGGKIDDLVVWLYSVFASIPSLLFILAFALLVTRGFIAPGAEKVVKIISASINVEPGMLAVYVAIGITGWVALCRVVRAETMKIKQLSFVEAAQIAGVGSPGIIIRHILPNLSHLVVIYFTLTFAGAVMMEVIVSYLGFGVQSFPSWGVMLSDGQEHLWRGVYWEIAAATLFIFLLVLSLNILGDRLRDVFDPRENRR